MASDPFNFADSFGPEKIVHLYDPGLGLRAMVVIDNLARGPATGGIRMAADVTLEECCRLARAMTFKNAAAGLAHGGAKSAILADPRMAPEDKERLVRGFAVAIRELVSYIPGPDMGLNEDDMGHVWDEIGRGIGLPAALGGVDVDRIGATGYGVSLAVEVAAPFAGLSPVGARVAIQGFGAVGRAAARFLEEKGARIVAIADLHGTLYGAEGMKVEALIEMADKVRAAGPAGASLWAYPGARLLPIEAVVECACDIFIPAARPDAITTENADRVQAKLVVEGANIGVTDGAAEKLFRRGIVAVPDFIANAGGVICAAQEARGGTAADGLAAITARLPENTRLVLEEAAADKISPRAAALNIAKARVRDAMALRRFHPPAG